VGSEDLSGEGLSLGLVKSEFSIWLLVSIFILIGLTLESVVLKDGSHEEIITISTEVSWDNSLVFLLSEQSLLEWVEVISSKLDHFSVMVVMMVVESLTSSKTKDSEKNGVFHYKINFNYNSLMETSLYMLDYDQVNEIK
jgi:hypothetical protein